MMGRQERTFGPLPPLTLEALVPSDHFSHHLERSLDLSFVRDLVREAYADSGRPPQPALVSGLRPDRASSGPREPDPHPGALWAGDLPSLFRFFEAIVEQCLAAGLVWGQELYKLGIHWRIPAIAIAEQERSGRLRGLPRRIDPHFRG